MRSAALCVFCMLSLVACDTEAPTDPTAMANAVADQIGHVKLSAPGQGTPILIFEEIHNSRPINLEEAIALVRLREKFSLTDIGLEGYLDSDHHIGDQGSAIFGNNQRTKAQVATATLREGEISSAEFMNLVYGTALWPLERANDYNTKADIGKGAVEYYLLKIAQDNLLARVKNGSIDNNDLTKIKRLSEEIKGATGALKADYERAYVNAIIAADPWTAERQVKLFNDDPTKFLDISEELSILSDVERKIGAEGISIDDDAKQQFAAYKTFIENESRRQVRWYLRS